MTSCCVSGCNNRYSPSSSIKFYRIPSGTRLFHRNRKRLWIEAIQRANGSSGELKGNVRICGAHFISGEASLDNEKPDFVPSVFTCAKQSQGPKKKAKWFYGSRKRRHHRANAPTLKEKTPPAANSPTDLQSSVLMEMDLPEETEKPSTLSIQKEKETCQEAGTEIETETVQSQTSAFQNVTLPSLKAAASISKMSPVVLLKSIISPAGEFQCELCIQTFIDVSELVKHKQMHEAQTSSVSGQADVAKPFSVPTDQPSFPCNMCDRSFTTIQNLKRHKLLHVKDGRKCSKCGVLFCRRHNHILFHPQPERITVSEEDSITSEEEHLDNSVNPENNVSDKLETQMKTTVNAQTTQTPIQINVASVKSLPPIPELLPKALPLSSHTRVSLTKSVMVSPTPCPTSPRLKLSKDPGVSFQLKFPVPDCNPTVEQPHLSQHEKLPPSLEIFSPQYLTSAFLDVKRNYEYILSKPVINKIENIVKKEPKEPDEPVLISPVKKPIKQVKMEKIAYDLEVIL